MATTTDIGTRAFPAAEIEALIRGELEEEAQVQVDLRGRAEASAGTGAYVEPEIDSLVAVSVLTGIELLIAPIKADESLIRPGGYASVDACVQDIMEKLKRRWRNRQRENA